MDVGSALRQARLARRLSLADIAELTNVRPTLVAAIENNEFVACGGDVFARGHVKTIAMALEIDPQPLLAAMGGEVVPAKRSVEHHALEALELRARGHVPSEARTWAVLALIAALIVGALLWQSRANDRPLVQDPGALPTVTSTDVATVTAEATPTTTASDTATSAPDPSSSSSTEPQAKPSAATSSRPAIAAVDLEITCLDTAEVRVSNATGVLFDDTMQAGDSRAFTSDTDVTVRIGNAAGILLNVNGIDQGSLGAPGEAYSKTFRVG